MQPSRTPLRSACRWTARLCTALLCAALAGCAGLPPDRGRGEVVALLAERGIDQPAVASPAPQIQLSETHAPDGQRPAPLTLNAAVHLALVNNPDLRGRFAELGFAAADVYDAGRLSNPQLSLGYLFVERGGLQNEKSIGLTQSFTDLILLPARRRLADGDFERVRLAVAGAVQRLATDVAHAWYRAAGAVEVAAVSEAIAETARISADLAERYFDAGNIDRRVLAEARAAAAVARLEALQADDESSRARAGLARLLGLPMHADAWQLPAGLHEPFGPTQKSETRATLTALADADRLDLAAARRRVAVRADALGVTRRFRYLGQLEAGPHWEWDDSGTRSVGPRLTAELPLFNQGAGKVARAEAELALAEAELATLEIGIVTELERAGAAVANAKARFTQYREVLGPARGEIVARRQEEVNFMLEGPFILLDARQDEYRAHRGTLEALGDYWMARVELAQATGQPPPDADIPGTEVISAALLLGFRQGSADAYETHDAHQSHEAHETHPIQEAHEAHEHGDHR